MLSMFFYKYGGGQNLFDGSVCDAFLLASISPCISKVHGHFWLKFGIVTSIYGALMLLNFCGDWGRELGARTKLLLVLN